MIGIWRPAISESIDGQPLAHSVSELFFDFPYERLPNSKILAFFLRPEGMAAAIAIYIFSKPFVLELQKSINPKSQWFRMAIIMHNFCLAVYSAVLAWNCWLIAISEYWYSGVFSTYCDPNGTLWGAGGFGAWAVIYYLSKYYEFLDTWILVLKGKQPSFLQVYHHTGVAFSVWGGVLSQSSWLLIVILLNSVIHTLMYTYFLIKTISPTTEIKAAKKLTLAQIAQFFTGIITTSGVLIMGESCNSASSRFSLMCSHVYAIGLIVLFFAFAKRKYKKA